MDAETTAVKQDIDEPSSTYLTSDNGAVCFSAIQVELQENEQEQVCSGAGSHISPQLSVSDFSTSCSNFGAGTEDAMKNKLEMARQRIFKMESELAQQKEKTKRSEEKANRLISQLLDEKEVEVKNNEELKSLLDHEKVAREFAYQKIKILKQSVENASLGLNQVISKIRNIFQQCYQHPNRIEKEVGEHIIKQLEFVSATYRSNFGEDNSFSKGFPQNSIPTELMPSDVQGQASRHHPFPDPFVTQNGMLFTGTGYENLKLKRKELQAMAQASTSTGLFRKKEEAQSLVTSDVIHEIDSMSSRDGSWRCFCGRGFRSKSSVYNHTRQMTTGYQYECFACGRQFLYCSALSAHLNSKKCILKFRNLCP